MMFTKDLEVEVNKYVIKFLNSEHGRQNSKGCLQYNCIFGVYGFILGT